MHVGVAIEVDSTADGNGAQVRPTVAPLLRWSGSAAPKRQPLATWRHRKGRRSSSGRTSSALASLTIVASFGSLAPRSMWPICR